MRAEWTDRRWRFADSTTPAYYRLRHDGEGMYEDFTGCGNTVDVRHPIVRRLILDSLRFWVT